MKSKKNPGNFSINDNKLRITNLTGQTSVLFEDISSISFKKYSIPNRKFLIYGIILWLGGGIFGNYKTYSGSGNSQLGIVFSSIGVILVILSFFLRIKFDDVIVETRGGMLLSYSVDEGKGSNQVDLIEEQKRLMTNKI
jgi:hypothetical protein